MIVLNQYITAHNKVLYCPTGHKSRNNALCSIRHGAVVSEQFDDGYYVCICMHPSIIPIKYESYVSDIKMQFK